MEKNRNKKKEFIDFNSLSNHDLKNLGDVWEQAAFNVELKLEKIMSFQKPNNEEKIERLWNVCNSLWRRVHILEKWKIKNKKFRN